MTLRIACAAAAASLLAACASHTGSSKSFDTIPMTPDAVIADGTVVDGTGAPGFLADVVIHDGRIAYIGEVAPHRVHPTLWIDAQGKTVAPGFIDTHAHGSPAKSAEFDNFVAQGVTSICLGMDGDSATDSPLPEWKATVDAKDPGVNVLPFVGHGRVRETSGVAYEPNPSAEQIASMTAIVRTAMDQGAWGMTTGLEYLPGMYSTRDELIETAKPVAEYGGLVMSHMRSEDDDAVEAAIDELLAQGEGASCPVHISHFKVVYGKGAARAEQLLAKLEAARARGVQVTADVYPYTASNTGIAIVFPDWALPPNDWLKVKEERREELEEFLRNKVNKRNGPEATLFGTDPYTGMTLKQVADQLGVPFEDALIDRIGPFGGSAAYFVMDANLQRRLLWDPNVMVCSDGSPTMHHPRGYGSFPKVIREEVAEAKTLTIEQAVHKMTGLPAKTLGLSTDEHRRGLLREGFAADVVVFDPMKVNDTATFEKPHQLATGIDVVVVNGVVARNGGEFTGERGGEVLLKR